MTSHRYLQKITDNCSCYPIDYINKLNAVQRNKIVLPTVIVNVIDSINYFYN